jgi:hypothetical protein
VLDYDTTAAGSLSVKDLKRGFSSSASANSLKSFFETLPRYMAIDVSAISLCQIAQKVVADLECVDYKLLWPWLDGLIAMFYGLFENDA